MDSEYFGTFWNSQIESQIQPVLPDSSQVKPLSQVICYFIKIWFCILLSHHQITVSIAMPILASVGFFKNKNLWCDTLMRKLSFGAWRSLPGGNERHLMEVLFPGYWVMPVGSVISGICDTVTMWHIIINQSCVGIQVSASCDSGLYCVQSVF